MIKVKANDLFSVAVAAEIWFKKHNMFNEFNKELKAATALKNELKKTTWDNNAELWIDESGF